VALFHSRWNGWRYLSACVVVSNTRVNKYQSERMVHIHHPRRTLGNVTSGERMHCNLVNVVVFFRVGPVGATLDRGKDFMEDIYRWDNHPTTQLREKVRVHSGKDRRETYLGYTTYTQGTLCNQRRLSTYPDNRRESGLYSHVFSPPL